MLRSLILLMLFSQTLLAKDVVLGRKYFNQFLGHLHKNPDSDSTSMTIIQCSHSVKVLKKANVLAGWVFAQVGEDKGFIKSEFLSEKRPSCFQSKYSRFYNSVELDITEMYFWGRLSDHYISGKSRIK